VQRLIGSRREIEVIPGSVERLVVEHARVRGVVIQPSVGAPLELFAPAVVLTTGTFMRALMHTGEQQTPGGRHGEHAAVGISGALAALGFELGRLKTGTPPRLKRSTIDWHGLEPQHGDDPPTPFSDLSRCAEAALGPGTFPRLPQVECRATCTTRATHELIRANLHRAPMYSGQIQSVGPRYCPSIEDKVVRFAERDTHNVFLEPESLRPEHAEWVYANGISTSLPADVQDLLVRAMPGCGRAEILRYGYAVEYDMVRPHQIAATGMTKLIEGLFLAGQINGTSGYEEAAGQGLLAGLNAGLRALGREPITLGRDQAYIGVLMDDLVTKTPVEPYRMFTSRAEHRLLLRADNAPDRLTPLAIELRLLATTALGACRAQLFAERRRAIAAIDGLIETAKIDGQPLRERARRPEYSPKDLAADLHRAGVPGDLESHVGEHAPALLTAHADRLYRPFIERQHAEVGRSADVERRSIPSDFDFAGIASMRTEARHALARFRPATLGQAGRLEGITPADVTLLAVLLKRHAGARREAAPQSAARPVESPPAPSTMAT
jgi:tRNA uridine 5-carboxymethylaminomethyl modification enzyme